MFGRIITGIGRRRIDAEGFFVEQNRLNIDGPEVLRDDPGRICCGCFISPIRRASTSIPMR